MEFDSNIVTEITAPNTVPFLPGNNIVGIGADIPPELSAAGLDAAIVFYSTDWDTSVSTPRIKYWAISSSGGTLTFVVCGSSNPSTTPATLSGGFAMAGRNTTLLNTIFKVVNTTLDEVLNIRPMATGSGTGAVIDFHAANATPAAIAGHGQLYVNSTGALVYRGPTTLTTVAPA